MQPRALFISTLPFGFWMLVCFSAPSAASPPAPDGELINSRTFPAWGVVKQLKTDDQTIVISHDAISNYMAAMTMPFKVNDTNELAGLQRGDKISFRLHVTESASWVDHLVKNGTVSLPPVETPGAARPPEIQTAAARQPLLDCPFTNELGQAVRLNDFRGQALAITFFYTRCPLPDYCPRLSKNFQEASRKLRSLPGAPANWHFLSVSFDPDFDTPDRLKTYAESYQYDSRNWSFLTGPADKIGELTRQSGVTYEFDTGTYNHNFRTLIIDARGHLQMVFPTAGDLSDQIVDEIIKAAAATNPPDTPTRTP